jgi:hypothetical protein
MEKNTLIFNLITCPKLSVLKVDFLKMFDSSGLQHADQKMCQYKVKVHAYCGKVQLFGHYVASYIFEFELYSGLNFVCFIKIGLMETIFLNRRAITPYLLLLLLTNVPN